MYTIKRAAEVTGISVATLRAWESRYGVVSRNAPTAATGSTDPTTCVRSPS